MCGACDYAWRMTKMIQIRNVPDDIHRALKVRAAMQGRSLSDLLLDEVIRLAHRPTEAELLERLAKRSPVDAPVSGAEAVRAERDGR